MKTQFKIISYLFIIVLFFNSCSTEELEFNEQETITLEAESGKVKASVPGCVQHTFFPAITQEYNVSSFGFCSVSFDIGSIITEIPPGASNIKYIIQVIEAPIDHPDGSSPGVAPEIHNFIFDSVNDINNDSFDVVYASDDDAPTPTLGFVANQKRLKVSFGVFNQGIGSLCTPFKPENVFFATANDCPF